MPETVVVRRRIAGSDRELFAAVSSGAREVDQLVLSAAYDLGVARLLFSWTEQEIDASARLATSPNTLDRVGAKETAMTLGVTVPMGAGTLFAEYGTSETDDVSDTSTTGGVTTNNLVGTSVKGEETAYSLGYRYALSKRTWAQATYGQYKIENRLRNATTSIADDIKSSGFALTLSHSF